MGDVQLSWYEMEIRHLIIFESGFIRLWFPAWNVVGRRIPSIVKEKEKARKAEEAARERLRPLVFTPEEEAEINAELDAREQGIDAWMKYTKDYHERKQKEVTP